MKNRFKFLLIVFGLGFFLQSSAQEATSDSKSKINRTLGVGFQSSFPAYGLSVKYGIDKNSVLQATIGPFSSGSFNLNYYGARYLYRFVKEEEQKIDPYLFSSLGLTTFSYDFLGVKESESFFSYGFGGGVESILGKAFGLSLDLGYGKFSVTDNVGVAGLFLGLGLHYYIK